MQEIPKAPLTGPKPTPLPPYIFPFKPPPLYTTSLTPLQLTLLDLVEAQLPLASVEPRLCVLRQASVSHSLQRVDGGAVPVVVTGQPLHTTSLYAPGERDQLLGTSYKGPATMDQLQGTSYKGPATRDQLQGTSYKGPAARDQLQGSSYKGPAARDQLQGSSYKGPATRDKLLGASC